jgi:hypothetical protein
MTTVLAAALDSDAGSAVISPALPFRRPSADAARAMWAGKESPFDAEAVEVRPA